MRRQYDRWAVFGIAAACVGFMAGVTNLRFTGTYAGYWVAAACFTAAGIVLTLKLAVWVLSRISFRQILMWIPGAAGLTAALLYVLSAASQRMPPPASQIVLTPISIGGPSAIPIPRPPIPETQPGFTRAVLLRVDRGPVPNRQYAFNDVTPDGARSAFFLEPDTASPSLRASQHLTFSVTDAKGLDHTLDVPVGADGIAAGRNVFVMCVIGFSKVSSYMRVFADGQEVGRRGFDTLIDLGSRRWQPTRGAYQTNATGLLASTQDMLAVPWALGDDKLDAVEADFRASHAGFLSGDDDAYFYAPLTAEWEYAPPIAGTFYYRMPSPPKP